MKTEYFIEEIGDSFFLRGGTIYKIENGEQYGFLWESQQWKRYSFDVKTSIKITPEEILKLNNIDNDNLGVKKEIEKMLFYKEVLNEKEK